MGTTVTMSGEACLGSESPVTGEPKVDPESPGTEEAKSGPELPGSGQSQWGIQYPCPDDAQVEPESQVQMRQNWGAYSLGTQEAQVRTRVTRSS